jgi:hypothetical protein
MNLEPNRWSLESHCQSETGMSHCIPEERDTIPHIRVGIRLSCERSTSHGTVSPGTISKLAKCRVLHVVANHRSELQQSELKGKARAETARQATNHLTRRCSRRITLAFLPFEAKVNACGNVQIRAGKRARG